MEQPKYEANYASTNGSQYSKQYFTETLFGFCATIDFVADNCVGTCSDSVHVCHVNKVFNCL